MSSWKAPPLVKAYEALGAVADGRVVVTAVLASAPLVSEAKTDVMAVAMSDAADAGVPALSRWLRRWIALDAVEGAAGSTRVAVSAKCASSSGDKAYDVVLTVDRRAADVGGDAAPAALPAAGAGSVWLHSTDSASVFVGYVGYPCIALLLLLGLVGGRHAAAAPLLRGVPWKALAVRHKNKWDAVVADALREHVASHACAAAGCPACAPGADAVEVATGAAASIQRDIESRVWLRGTGGAKPKAKAPPKRQRE
jgi:hypothetical protein